MLKKMEMEMEMEMDEVKMEMRMMTRMRTVTRTRKVLKDQEFLLGICLARTLSVKPRLRWVDPYYLSTPTWLITF